MGTTSSDTMPYGMSFSPLPSLLLWPLPGRQAVSCQILSYPLPTSCSSHLAPHLAPWSPCSPRCTYYCSPSEITLHQAASTPGHTIEVGVRRKLAGNLPACQEVGVDFHPIVAEALGGVGQDMVELIQALGTLINQCINSLDSPNPTSHLFHRVAITLWRGSTCV